MFNQPGQAEHKVLSAVPPAAPAAPSAPAASASSAPPNNRVKIIAGLIVLRVCPTSQAKQSTRC